MKLFITHIWFLWNPFENRKMKRKTARENSLIEALFEVWNFLGTCLWRVQVWWKNKIAVRKRA